MVKRAHEENDALSRVLAQVNREHEELRRRRTEPAAADENSEAAFKAQALRNVARALENENELLCKERQSLEAEIQRMAAEARVLRSQTDDLKRELAAKDQERGEYELMCNGSKVIHLNGIPSPL
jgi:predicted RNase H-like nuclease (RuvC/YqgF family)